MLATGMRVVRGPDWVWENQGKSSTSLNSFVGDLLLPVINIHRHQLALAPMDRAQVVMRVK